MSFVALGKKIAAAAKKGKDLNKVDLGKYGSQTAAKRDKLAKGVRKLRKAGHKKVAKKLAKNPEQFRGPQTFLTHDEQKKMGTPGQYYLGKRKETKTNYKRGGKVKKRK